MKLTEREKLLEWVFDSGVIKDPALKKIFTVMLNRVIAEAVNGVSQPSNSIDDDFSIFNKWKDHPNPNGVDDYGGVIKHFQD